MKRKNSLWLIGTGVMAKNYAIVLRSLAQPFEVVGRSKISSKLFSKEIECNVNSGGLRYYLKKKNKPKIAIVAVGIESLIQVSKDLINSGTKKILLEKPGGLNLNELIELNQLAKKKSAKIFIAYNRRFYNSVKKMKKLIDKDGGLVSMNFEFTELSKKIEKLKKNILIKKNWLISNSSHVIDLAFYMGGKPLDWSCWHSGSGDLSWHPKSSRFCGAGITNTGVMFSYFSNWKAPGRWGLEFMTTNHRYILRPIEELKVIKFDKTKVQNIKLHNQIDKKFKPGLFVQTQKFLKGEYNEFCTISEQIENMKIYKKISGYL